MQHWEYKLIEVYASERNPEARWIWTEDGLPLPGYPSQQSYAALIGKFRALGNEGWELVSIAPLVSAMHYWFKRPVAAPPPLPNTST